MPNNLITSEDQQKLSKENINLVKKFNEFLKQNSNKTGNSNRRLTQTMRAYIKEELNPDSAPVKNKKHLDQFDMNVYYKLNLIKDLQNDKHKSK